MRDPSASGGDSELISRIAEVDESIFSGFKDVKKKSSSPSNAFSMWDVSFGIPINELKEILNAAEIAEEFADDAPKWDDATK
ncbi:hypothetical protein TNCV_1936341 [Trichonephila clavipes]|nr:hypothetical protein TNCV_1936341 [Trichonephila clavipes]